MEAKVWFDGAAQPNPGIRGIGVLIVLADGNTERISKNIGFGSNNEAEAIALLTALTRCNEMGVRRVTVFGDSQLIVNQASGAWHCGAPNLKPIIDDIRKLACSFEQCEINFVRRNQNVEADTLSKKALSGVPC